MKPFATFTSHVAVLNRDDIDTDQIIGARFLKTTRREGLGEHLFEDWRAEPSFILNKPHGKTAKILLAGKNFGCGSSREHAPWALADWGFRAVIAPTFADIFANNSLKNGLLPIAIGAEEHATLVAKYGDPSLTITVSLEAEQLLLADQTKIAFSIDPFAKHCLLNGLDDLSYLLSLERAIAAFEEARTVAVLN